MVQTTQVNSKSKYSRLGQAASLYANRFRFSVHPLAMHGKIPITSNGCRDATRDPIKISDWWQKTPFANIGIATGGGSGIGVLDIDAKPDANQILFELETEFGKLPETPHVLTGGRGLHFYFKVDEPLPNKAGIRAGVDFRGEGGYVVAPPSTHSNGNLYEWEICHHINDVPLAPIPVWLKNLVTGGALGKQQTRPKSFWSAMLESGVTEGKRNQSVAEITGHLLRRYIDPELVIHIIKAINNEYVKPPLPPTEIERIVESIAGKELKRRKASK